MSNSVYYRVVQPLPLFNLRIFLSFSPTPTKSISDVSLLLPSYPLLSVPMDLLFLDLM